MPEYNFYVLAYFDLLGQGELLESLTDRFVFDCITGKKDELIQKMKPTFDRVKQFRDHLRKVVGDINQPIPLPQELSGKISVDAWKKLTRAKVDVEFMGDAALLKVLITSDPNEAIPVVSIRDLMTGISMQMLAFLGAGIPVRGAIELGWGTHIEENSIYGTMLHRAFRLEKEAGYPRIVIGQNFINYIQPLATQPQKGVSNEVAPIIAKTAKEVLALIVEDDDGELILHYLRKELYSANETLFNDCIPSAKKFIQLEIARQRQSRDKKLMGSYCKLRRFFQKCNVW
ncbi:MAG: hypothetical protein HYS22_02620 [Deltaproteobacteria bacterium]|nr:hypothetical protein [Deltaproteobacteria bacterium]